MNYMGETSSREFFSQLHDGTKVVTDKSKLCNKFNSCSLKFWVQGEALPNLNVNEREKKGVNIRSGFQ